MILEIQHETRLEYSEPVVESIAEVRMEPVSDADQSCHSFHLAIRPSVEPARYQDGFGNRVHHFNILTPHQEVRVLSASVVETHPRKSDIGNIKAFYPLDADRLDLEALDFLGFRGPVRTTPALLKLAEVLRPRTGTRLVDVPLQIMNYFQKNFEYAPDVTQASSPIDDLLEHKKGVCQDFAHLLIGLLRSFGIPARYVSGYIHRPGKESQSHAWCEAWFAEHGWFGFDPTNDSQVNEHFVKVAIGRDYTDVPPNKGVYCGQGAETISVRVATRLLERLPSLSWQEQLPPLQVPLTAIRPRFRAAPRMDMDAQQQQQQ
jgi:transglutaminase-like putative cysteine protease